MAEARSQRCSQHLISGLLCKNNAIIGSELCTTHYRIAQRKKQSEEVVLPMPPLPLNSSQEHDAPSNPSGSTEVPTRRHVRIDQKRRVVDDICDSNSDGTHGTVENSKIYDGIVHLTQYIEKIDISQDIRKLTEMLEKLTTVTQNLNYTNISQNHSVHAVKTPKDKSILRRAKALFYHEYKQKADKVHTITQAAIKAHLLPPNTIKAHWAYVKNISDREFDALSEIEKKIYLDTSMHMLMNNIRVNT
jgi:hypothetical protein